MLAEMLVRIPKLDPSLDVSYLSYEELQTPDAIARCLETDQLPLLGVVAVNLQIEVQAEVSLALAEHCARQSIPLFNYVQDYWPHHFEPMQQLTETYGVRLLGASPFILSSLTKDHFEAAYLPMGAQLPPKVKIDSMPFPKVIGSVGRLVRRKRFPDIVRAFCEGGLDQTAQLRLTLIRSHVFGSEQDEQQLHLIRQEMTRPGVNPNAIHCSMTPCVPPDYASLAIYVYASDYEGFSMTPYEAAYAGCPPIVSDIPPHRLMAETLFHDQAEAFLYPVCNTDALAERLRDEVETGWRWRYVKEHQEEIRDQIERRFSLQTTARAFVDLGHSLTPMKP